MVPRGGLPQSNENKDLEFGGTLKPPAGSFGFLPRVSHQDTTPESGPTDWASTLTLIINPAPQGAGRYEAHLDNDDRVLCVSTRPFFDAARVLIANGYDPNTEITLRHAGSNADSLSARLGTAASLTVEETGFRTPVPPLEAHSYSGGDAKDCFRRAGSYHPSPAPNPGSWQ